MSDAYNFVTLDGGRPTPPAQVLADNDNHPDVADALLAAQRLGIYVLDLGAGGQTTFVHVRGWYTSADGCEHRHRTEGAAVRCGGRDAGEPRFVEAAAQ